MAAELLSHAVFLDRDGTISCYVEYCRRIEDFELLPGSAEAIRLLNEAGLRVIVVTNQSGVARGYFTSEVLQAIHRKMQQQLQQQAGAWVDAIYVCPHHPDDGCACRKPRPAMLFQASRDLMLSLAESYAVGDRLLDVRCGQAAGTRSVLVRCGHPVELMEGMAPDHEAETLLEAAKWIVAQEALRQHRRAASRKVTVS